jgi:ligand-binding SRPBCC domain-containing protein
MPVYECRSGAGVPADVLYAWHARDGAFERLLPPWERAELDSSSGTLADRRLVMRVRVGRSWVRWVARHDGHEPGRWFRDVRDAGPFAAWTHTHRFEDSAGGSSLLDRVEYELPLGAIGRLVAGRAVAAQVLLRWGVEAGMVVLPKSVRPERVRENAAIFVVPRRVPGVNRPGGAGEGRSVRRVAGQGPEGRRSRLPLTRSSAASRCQAAVRRTHGALG